MSSHSHIFRDVHFFGGSGGGGIGFKRGHARIGMHSARFESMGSLDVDPIACMDFEMNVGAPAHAVDLFTMDQFLRFHSACTNRCRICKGKRVPPDGWKELKPSDIRHLFLNVFPDVIFFSPPCKGFSALLNPKAAKGVKYQALNELVTRALFLALEAWGDDPPSLIIMENVPRIRTRGVKLLDTVKALLHSYGYAVRDLDHNCGELGGLAQNRQRFLLVARHKEKVPPFLYQPRKKRVRGIGEVLSDLPIPGFGEGGPLHELPNLEWITWLRLALIREGKDWRDLHELKLDDSGKYLRDIGIVPVKAWRRGVLGVEKWNEPSKTVTTRSAPTNGAFCIADPRTKDYKKFCSLGILPMNKPSGTITGQAAHGSGFFSIPDPRIKGDLSGESSYFSHVYRIVRLEQSGPLLNGQPIEDPRPAWSMKKKSYRAGGHYGIIPWTDASGTISAYARLDRGKFCVADPRNLPEPKENCKPLIISLDGTWHRPLTLLELMSLQGYPINAMFGGPTSVVREHIGNSVPPPAATAIANRMLETLLLAALDETCFITDKDVWVQPDPLPQILGFADQDELKTGS